MIRTSENLGPPAVKVVPVMRRRLGRVGFNLFSNISMGTKATAPSWLASQTLSLCLTFFEPS